ncbi:9159_t:CDS:2, partial [Funneliformis geosporum]
LKKAAIFTSASSSSSTSTSVPTNINLEIVQEFKFFDIFKIATPNKISPVIPPSNNNNNDNNKVDNIPENSSSTKDRLKLLDPDEYLEDYNMEEDLKGFTVITKATLFAVANVAATALHITIPDLNIDTFCDFSQYKADIQFNERTIHVTDILLQMKPTNIKQEFAKYGTVTNFKMTVRGI